MEQAPPPRHPRSEIFVKYGEIFAKYGDSPVDPTKTQPESGRKNRLDSAGKSRTRVRVEQVSTQTLGAERNPRIWVCPFVGEQLVNQ